MKKLLLVTLMLSLKTFLMAQTSAEWLRQKATQKKYLLQQIAALHVYGDYLSKGYSIARNGLQGISEKKQKDRDQHEAHFHALRLVNPAIRHYTKIANILALQLSIGNEATQVIRICRQSRLLNDLELVYIREVFNKLGDDCLHDLDMLLAIISDEEGSLTDDERLIRIDKLYRDSVDKQVFARSFSGQVKGLCIQRKHDKKNINISKKINRLP